MKKTNLVTLLPLLLFCLGLSACSSSDNKPGDFEVTGVQDVVIKKFANTGPNFINYTNLPLSITYTGVAPEYVKLSVANVPAKLGATTSPTEGNIPFTTTLLLTDTNVAPGSYNLTLNAATPSGKNKAYNFKLTVKAPPTCTEAFVGDYRSSSSSTDPQTNYTVSRITDSIVTINNYANSGSNLTMRPYCSFNQITIPSQTMVINNVTCTVSGSGSSSLDNSGYVTYMYLNITVYSPQTGYSYRSYNLYRQN